MNTTVLGYAVGFLENIFKIYNDYKVKVSETKFQFILGILQIYYSILHCVTTLCYYGSWRKNLYFINSCYMKVMVFA